MQVAIRRRPARAEATGEVVGRRCPPSLAGVERRSDDRDAVLQVPRRDAGADIAKMASLLTKVGPGIPQIGREIGRQKETVRYWYKEKIVEKGFTLKARASLQRLGLRRVVAKLSFAREYEEHASEFFAMMARRGYLSSFGRTLPGGDYLVQESVPVEHVNSLIGFLNGQRAAGVFSSVDVTAFDHFRNPPMRVELYDFDSGTWGFDWSLTRVSTAPTATLISDRMEFDRLDLEIVSALQEDAGTTLTKVSDGLNANYKMLNWHHKKHVEERGLVSGYVLDWRKAGDYRVHGIEDSPHRYLQMALLVRDLGQAEAIKLAHRFTTLPFVYSEAYGRNYFAEFAFPMDSISEGLQFIAEVIRPVRARAEYHIVDRSDSAEYPISPTMFDGVVGRWTFDLRALNAEATKIFREKVGAPAAHEAARVPAHPSALFVRGLRRSGSSGPR